MYKQFVVALVLIAGANAFWTECGDGLPPPTAVSGPTCSAILNRCVATRGSNMALDITFTPAGAHNNLEATGVISHNLIPLPIPVFFDPPNDNACNNLLLPGSRDFVGCPTVPGEARLWNVVMGIPTAAEFLPAVPGATLRIALRPFGIGPVGNPIMCTNVRIDVV